MFSIILVIIGVVLIGVHAFGVTPTRVHLGWLGLAVALVGAFLTPHLGV